MKVLKIAVLIIVVWNIFVAGSAFVLEKLIHIMRFSRKKTN